MVSMGGNLLLNISPMGDGSIPAAQQQVLLAVGEWLQKNGEGIYGAHPWRIMGEGPLVPSEPPGDWKGGSTAVPGPKVSGPKLPPPGEADFRFTTAKDAVYAFGFKRPATQARLTSFSATKVKVERVTMPDVAAPLQFHQTQEALFVELPQGPFDAKLPYVLRVEGNRSIA
jgi:alpha-L-fucosidase